MQWLPKSPSDIVVVVWEMSKFFFTKSNITVLTSIVCSFYIPVPYTYPIVFKNASSTTDTYTSHIQVYPYIFLIVRNNVPHLACWISCLWIPLSFYLTYSQPFVFSSLWILVHSLITVLQQFYIMFFLVLMCLFLILLLFVIFLSCLLAS